MTALPELSAAKASWVRTLMRERKARDAEGVLVLEGEKAIRELVARDPGSVKALVLTAAARERLTDLPRSASMPVYLSRDTVFEKLSDLVTAAGVLAVVRRPQWKPDDLLRRARLLALYGETIQDPSNVGAMVRTAAAFQFDALWLSSDCADPYAPKAVRAAAGAIFFLPIFTARSPELFAMHKLPMLAAVPPGAGSRSIEAITELPARAVVAFGNESRGLSPATTKAAQTRFHIPLSLHVESLNVAAAVAVSAFYFRRLARATPSAG